MMTDEDSPDILVTAITHKNITFFLKKLN